MNRFLGKSTTFNEKLISVWLGQAYLTGFLGTVWGIKQGFSEWKDRKDKNYSILPAYCIFTGFLGTSAGFMTGIYAPFSWLSVGMIYHDVNNEVKN